MSTDNADKVFNIVRSGGCVKVTSLQILSFQIFHLRGIPLIAPVEHFSYRKYPPSALLLHQSNKGNLWEPIILMSSQTLGSNGQEGGRWGGEQEAENPAELTVKRPAGPRPDPHSLMVSQSVTHWTRQTGDLSVRQKHWQTDGSSEVYIWLELGRSM